MRTYFRNTKRPKLVAESLTVVFPVLKHTEALEWAGKIFGYRDWHDLNESANESVTATPLLCEVGPDSPEFEKVSQISEFQSHKLQELMGDSFPFAAQVAPWTIHARNREILRSPKRLVKLPAGLRPLHASLAEDRFFCGDKPTADLGSLDYGDACYACYQVLPADLDADALQSKFVARIKKASGPQLAQLAKRMCDSSELSPATATFQDDEGGQVHHRKVMTLFLYDEDAREIRGVGQFVFGILVGNTGSGTPGALLSCDCRGAVLEPGYDYLDDQMAAVVAQTMTFARDMLKWVQVGGELEPVRLELEEEESESNAKYVLDVAIQLMEDEEAERGGGRAPSERATSNSELYLYDETRYGGAPSQADAERILTDLREGRAIAHPISEHGYMERLEDIVAGRAVDLTYFTRVGPPAKLVAPGTKTIEHPCDKFARAAGYLSWRAALVDMQSGKVITAAGPLLAKAPHDYNVFMSQAIKDGMATYVAPNYEFGFVSVGLLEHFPADVQKRML
ncbi:MULTISPECIES: nuclear hormone receptor family protein [Ralstonia]|uniref:Uncharacterized protein n=2 Tax=Ralstonia pickettii TaxID=329 RepID=R0CMT7_RALPI|nr:MULTISPECIES: hypothetical protein [Ralstonia]ENZ77981.1 hypothetical protein OR214_02257 [Ralstonia pickettii OR214]MCM3581928.1 hypothetical protein [Ralstonia pickettii]